MTDNVWPQGPDGLFDLQKVLALDNVSDYVERGVSFTPTWSADETDISAGTAVIRDGDLAFIVEPDSRTDLALPSSTGVNYVYLAFDPDVDNAISYHVDTDDTPPADPSLKVAELDASTNTVTRVNRDPAVTFEGAALTSDLDAGGHDLNNVGSTTTDQITNVYDHVTTTPEDTIENDLVAGESVAIGPGTYAITLDASDEGISVGVNDVTIYLHPDATLQLADGQTATGTDGGLIALANGVSGVEIKGRGTIDGNKANNTNPSNPANFGLIRWGDNVSDVGISGLTFQNSPGDAIRPFASSGAESTDIDIHHVHVEGCVEGIVWTYTDSLRLTSFVVRNMTGQDAVEPVRSQDWVIESFLIDTAQQSGIDVFGACENGSIANGVIRNPAQTSENGIGVGGNNEVCKDISVENVSIVGSGVHGVSVRASGPHENINFVNVTARGCAQNGFTPMQGEVNFTSCAAIANDGAGWNHQGSDSRLESCVAKNNDQTSSGNDGITLNGPRLTVVGCQSFDDQATATQRLGFRVTGSGTDCRIADFSASGNRSGIISDGGTRTRIDGAIGGGPVGGVDLSTVTGQFEGDRAMSSGATANTGDTAYSYWTWDATNSVWTDQDGNTV